MRLPIEQPACEAQRSRQRIALRLISQTYRAIALVESSIFGARDGG
ncbi:hypothetical protein [Coleofasciculus sp. FACHB-1120]|nr:hypothetical protein [Coleofasciculus sp. FACHB-1120]MBD2743699.1 hypothetical protein [Coleofasciculus sp. FACHB-1120]